jgi:hypothetical protein
MSTLKFDKAVATLDQVKKDLSNNTLTVDKLNQLLESQDMSPALYAAYMKKIGAKDKITNQEALDFFKSVNSLYFVRD